jgi:hypothetical protein
MANDSISALKAELEAALIPLNDQISGNSDTSLHPITDALRSQLGSAVTAMSHRRDLINQALDDINKLLGDLQTLEADGYPTPQTFEMSDVVMGELNGEITQGRAGASVFHSPMGASIEVSMSAPVDDTSSRPRRERTT